MPWDEIYTPRAVNVEVVASLRIGWYWDAGKDPSPGLSLELAPSLTHVFYPPESGTSPVSPILGGYVQGRAAIARGLSASVGARAGIVAAEFTDDLGFVEWPGAKLEFGHLWTKEGSGWEAGAILTWKYKDLETAFTYLAVPLEKPGFRIHAGPALPLIPAGAEGRPLRVGSAALLPPVALLTRSKPPPEAHTWLQRGREEHASIGAFLRLAAELHALGAPRPLVGRALRAAREEAGHARLCFGEASARAGGPVVVRPVAARPRSWSNRRQALAVLATESWVDGVLGEGQAASEAVGRRDAAPDAANAALEDQIATEEADHTRLGSEILDWCLKDGGAETRSALRACGGAGSNRVDCLSLNLA